MAETTKADLIGEKIEELASRLGRTFSDGQAVRAYLLAEAYNTPREDIGRRLGHRRGDVGNLVARGRILVKDAVEKQLVTMEEMRAWLTQM